MVPVDRRISNLRSGGVEYLKVVRPMWSMDACVSGLLPFAAFGTKHLPCIARNWVLQSVYDSRVQYIIFYEEIRSAPLMDVVN